MKTIDEDIRSGNLKQIYLLYGTEDYLKRQVPGQVKERAHCGGRGFRDGRHAVGRRRRYEF